MHLSRGLVNTNHSTVPLPYTATLRACCQSATSREIVCVKRTIAGASTYLKIAEIERESDLEHVCQGR